MALRLILAYSAIYFIWGSGYLATRVAVQGFPPFLMTGLRQLIAGSVLFAFLRLRGAPAPTRAQWKDAALLACVFMVGGSALSAWSLRWIESGLGALIMGAVPMFTVLMEGKRLKGRDWAALGLGLSGVAILVWPSLWGGRREALGVAAMLAAAASWAWGSLLAKKMKGGPTPLSSAMQMLAAGAVIVPLAWPAEGPAFHPLEAPARCWWALGLLIVFNSWITYSAFQWLLKVQPAVKVATYAYVNPIVAVWLGWWLLDETLTPRIIAASACVAVSVAFLLRSLQEPAPA